MELIRTNPELLGRALHYRTHLKPLTSACEHVLESIKKFPAELIKTMLLSYKFMHLIPTFYGVCYFVWRKGPITVISKRVKCCVQINDN